MQLGGCELHGLRFCFQDEGGVGSHVTWLSNVLQLAPWLGSNAGRPHKLESGRTESTRAEAMLARAPGIVLLGTQCYWGSVFNTLE